MTTSDIGKGIGLFEMAKVLADSLPKLTARERVAMPMALFGRKAIITTSFGPTSAALLDLSSRVYPGVMVLNVRHGHETPETLAFIERCEKIFPIELVTIDAPHLRVPEPGGKEFDEFRQLTKVVPLRDALSKIDAWFWLSGVMHDETETRRTFEMASVRHGTIVIYPILDWTSARAFEYCIENNLPLNPDYFDPCKGPDQSLECGLHSDDNLSTGSGRIG